MRSSLNFNLRPAAAYVAAILLAALCWQDATSVYASPARAGATLPPLPQQKPIVKAERSPESSKALQRRVISRPSGRLNFSDEIATLHAIHTALATVGDGGAYVWRRGNGRITGLFRPTTSFKSNSGEICRHIIIRLNSRRYSREVEGIACRDNSGGWSLSG